MERYLSRNQLTLEGVVTSPPTFSHQVFDEAFYSLTLRIARLSDQWDEINVIIAKGLIPAEGLLPGQKLLVQGQLRSYNRQVKGRTKLVLTAFAKSITFDFIPASDPNQVTIKGTLCKPPIYRHTPFGREISDLLIAVNRAYNKSDYIPVIAWGKMARDCRKFEVGDEVLVQGRFQSRIYEKAVDEITKEKKVAYELSASLVEKEEDNEAKQKIG